MAVTFTINASLLLDLVHAVRAELAFLSMFGLLIAVNQFLHRHAVVGRPAPSTSKARKPHLPRRASEVRSRCPVERQTTPQYHPQVQLDTRRPSAEQLRNPAWVSTAVQHLCRTSSQQGVELYRDAVRAGLDLMRIHPAESQRMFMSMISSLIRSRRADSALMVLKDCQEKGCGITVALFSSATKLCTSQQLYKDCLKIYDYVSKTMHVVELVDDRSIWSCLLFCSVEARQYGRCALFFDRVKSCGAASNKDYGNRIRSLSALGQWRQVLEMLKDMHAAGVTVDSIAYNTALATCVQAHQMDVALELLSEMEAIGGIADVITYNTLAKGFARAGQLSQSISLYERMRSKGILPSQVSYGILLDCCINLKEMEKAIEIFETMTREGCVMNTILYTTLIKGFARADQIDQAMKVFEQMRKQRAIMPDLITFSILIKANCDHGRLETSLGLLEAMMELQLAPDEVVFNNLLGGCVREGDVSLAKRLYRDMVEGGIRPSNATFSIMIRVYSACKMLDEAVDLIKTEPDKQGVVPEFRLYVQLAQACLRERQGRRAVEVYKLLAQRTTPTAVMHSSLIGLCAKLNMFDTGAEIMALAGTTGAQVSANDAANLYEAAVRRRRVTCAEAIAATATALGVPVAGVEASGSLISA